jgi:hypothetical protein
MLPSLHALTVDVDLDLPSYVSVQSPPIGIHSTARQVRNGSNAHIDGMTLTWCTGSRIVRLCCTAYDQPAHDSSEVRTYGFFWWP